MSDLLQRLKLGTSNRKLISWPGTNTQVMLRVLSQQEHQEAAFATERLFKNEKIEVNLITSSEYDNEMATQLLYRAMHDPEKPEEAICSIAEFRRSLSKEEKKSLIDEYQAFEKECSPSPEGLTDDEFAAILESLKKKPETTISGISSISLLKKLLLFTVSPPQNSQADNGSISS